MMPSELKYLAGVTLYHRRLGEALRELKALGYTPIELECKGWRSELDFHKAVAKAFSFPEYYGQNLNAFYDCIKDTPLDGRAIVFRSFDAFIAKVPHAIRILSILDEVSRFGILRGKRLVILVQSDDPALVLPKIGGYAPPWNQHEWADKDRGL